MSEPMPYMSSHADVPNKPALWAMILGITGLVLSLAVIGGLLGLVALVLGIFAVIRPGRKGMAITGITTGALALPLAFVALFFWLGMAMAIRGMPAARTAARTSITRAQMGSLKRAIDTFEVDNGRPPTSAEGLDALVNVPPALAATGKQELGALPPDGWGRPFNYQGPDFTGDGTFIITSAGPDGIFGTPDDINESTPP